MTSLKKLIAVAAASLPLIGSAQTPPADAAAAKPPPPLYTIYGTFNVNFQNASAKGAFDRTASIISRRAISVDSTNLGIKGTADVDYGLQVTWQCESTADVSGQGAAGLCGRNSRLGLTHPVYGTVFYGNWDTPYKALTYGTKADDVFGNTDVFGYNDLLSSPGFNTVSSAYAGANTVSFDLRASNSVAYWSPKISGASLRVQYTADETRTSQRAELGVNPNTGYGYALDPYLISVALNYDFGPLSLAAGYERHYDGGGLVVLNGTGGAAAPFVKVSTSGAFNDPVPNTNAVAANSNTVTNAAFYTPVSATNGAHATPTTQDDAWKLGAGYELATPFGPLTISAAVEQIKYTQDKPIQNSFKEYKRMAYMVGAKHRMGNHEFRARYTVADKGSAKLGGPADVPEAISREIDTTGYGANSTALGYSYYLSKAAQVYLFYVRIDNDFRARYTFATQGPNGFAAAVPAGSVPQSYGLGLRYGF